MPEAQAAGDAPQSGDHPGAVHWLADYVYGTIATLVAIAGLTFESNPGELTTAGGGIVGAVAIWFGVAALLVVGIGTAGGPERPLGRRIGYVAGVVLVGVAIVLLEAGVHLL